MLTRRFAKVNRLRRNEGFSRDAGPQVVGLRPPFDTMSAPIVQRKDELL